MAENFPNLKKEADIQVVQTKNSKQDEIHPKRYHN